MAVATIQDQPETISVPEAARRFGISRGFAYELVATNKFPVRVIKAGSRVLVPTARVNARDGGSPSIGTRELPSSLRTARTRLAPTCLPPRAILSPAPSVRRTLAPVVDITSSLSRLSTAVQRALIRAIDHENAPTPASTGAVINPDRRLRHGQDGTTPTTS
jgi:predicted DNA-binding transcriptional regulator AlpA